MATAKQCDRCKEFYKPYISGSAVGKYNAITQTRRDDYNNKITYQSSAIDLCEDCMDDFIKWLARRQ